MKLNSNSKFWMPSEILYDESNIEMRAMGLISYKNAISNFVNIVTGKNTKVSFDVAGTVNFAEEKGITIAGNISSNNVDVYCGISLHEASHIVKTDFSYLKSFNQKFPQTLNRLFKSKGFDNKDAENISMTILNYIEDRYIDNWAFNEFEGYREYYRCLYDFYWNSKAVAAGLKYGMYCEQDLNSYMFRIINMTNPASNLDVLPGLRKMCEQIDLENISRLKTTRDRGDVAFDVLHTLLENIEISNPALPDIPIPSLFSNKPKNVNDKLNTFGENSSECDIDFKNQLDFTNNKFKKESISFVLDEIVSAIENSNMKIGFVNLNLHGKDSKFPITIIEKFGKGSIQPKISNIFSSIINSNSDCAIKQGNIMGRLLGKQLKIRGEARTTIFNRLSSGKIDRRLVNSLGYGNEKIFYNKHVDVYKPIHIHISLDASGSMQSGNKWKESVAATVAICKGCSMVDNIHVVLTVRTTTISGNALLVYIYDSKKDKFSKILDLFRYIGPGGETPEGLLYGEVSNSIPHENSEIDCYFLNISDGFPSINGGKVKYSGKFAHDHTAREVRKMKASGVTILSYLIDPDGVAFGENPKETFKKMYGRDSVVIDVSNVLSIASTINKKFLEKSKMS